MGILNNSNAISVDSGYDITDSLRFRRSATAYLQRTPSSAGNRKTWTWSCWVKKSFVPVDAAPYPSQQLLFANDNATTANTNTAIQFLPTNTIRFLEQVNGGSTAEFNLTSTQLFRDTSAWYHVVVAYDTTQSTASNRVKIYINGTQITSFSSSTYPSLNFDGNVNKTCIHNIGSDVVSGINGTLDGYMTEVNFVDGTALAPTDFGESDDNGTWIPKKYTGSYGTNGFYLNFSNSSSVAALGTDSSGNSNTWTVNNVSLTAGVTYDLMSDVPTLTDEDTANFPTLNPLSKAGNVALTDGNLTNAWDSSAGTSQAATMATPTTGKWYYEFVTTVSSSTPVRGVIGIQKSPNPQSEFPGYGSSDGWSIYLHDGNKFNGSTSGGDSYGSSFAVNDVCMVAVDLDNSKIYWGKNGTWFNSGNPATGANAAYTNVTGPVFFALGDGSGSNTFTGHMNFGQRPFAYTPPTGFKKLNTFNLPDSTIKDGSEHFDTALYTGSGATRSIDNTITASDGTETGEAFKFGPDLTWIKVRNSASYEHMWFDSVRGVTKYIRSNTTAAEGTVASTLTSFDSNGFSLGSNNDVNGSGFPIVAWNWRGSDSTAASNTDGTITSTVSANPTAGFSVATYTGTGSTTATIGHGLGVAPKMIILKSRSASSTYWLVGHDSIGWTKGLYLNATNAEATYTPYWNNTAPTSNVFTLGNWGVDSNGSGSTYVAYCFAEVEGYSKIGSYTGNGSADGPFIYTGFRPAFILRKNSQVSDEWSLIDSARSSFNQTDETLVPNDSGAERGYWDIDILSNGFKVRTSESAHNGSGNTIIYMAFAENPFKNSNAR